MLKERLNKWRMPAMLSLMLISLSACATPVPEACAWLRQVSPDPGFQTRWTRAEKEQIDALDRNIEQQCKR